MTPPDTTFPDMPEDARQPAPPHPASLDGIIPPPPLERDDAATNHERELAELQDRYMRALADAENLRRRADRDKQDAGTYAITHFARDLLAVADNLHRATQAITDTLRADPAVKNILIGVEMTEKELISTLTKYGVSKVEALGQKLDPNQHQAVMEIDSPTHAPGTVAQVMQEGYMLKDRLLRPAMVAVAKASSTPDMPQQRVDTSA